MGAYNLLYTSLTCPRCNHIAEMEISLHFGYRQQDIYHLGDTYQWWERKQPQNGGRPPGIEIQQEGYVGECPHCQKDFFVKVTFQNDTIVAAEPDLDKEPYIPD